MPNGEVLELTSRTLLYSPEREYACPIFIQETDSALKVIPQDSLSEEDLIFVFSDDMSISSLGYFFPKEQLDQLLGEKQYYLLSDFASILSKFKKATEDDLLNILMALKSDHLPLSYIIKYMYMMYETEFNALVKYKDEAKKISIIFKKVEQNVNARKTKKED